MDLRAAFLNKCGSTLSRRHVMASAPVAGGDGEFARSAAAVRSHLVLVERSLAAMVDAARLDDVRLEAWDGVSATGGDLQELERALGDASATLASLKKMLVGARCASHHQREHYAAMVASLDSKRDAMVVAVARERARRVAALASRAASRDSRPIAAPVAAPIGPLYAAPRNDTVATMGDVDPALHVTEEERVQLLLESESMQAQEMQRVAERARALQRQLGSLAQLMTVFSLEIVRQKEDLLRISDTIVKATANVEMGNVKLVEASSSSVDFRFFVLLFLIILSAALVFLNWYS